MSVKPCKKCGSTDRYEPSKGRCSGRCQPCHKAYSTKYRMENSYKCSVYDAEWRAKNPSYDCDKRRSNPQFRLVRNLRARLYSSIKTNQKTGSAVRDLGCSVAELSLYLEVRFQLDMTWGNYGQWHIDHIIPLSKFDLTDREQFLKACHFSNLQPLWAKENLSKGKKIVPVGESGSPWGSNLGQEITVLLKELRHRGRIQDLSF